MYFVCKMVANVNRTDVTNVYCTIYFDHCINAHSKWLEACVVETPTLAGIMQRLRHMFATHGIPETIMLTMVNIKHDS